MCDKINNIPRNHMTFSEQQPTSVSVSHAESANESTCDTITPPNAVPLRKPQRLSRPYREFRHGLAALALRPDVGFPLLLRHRRLFLVRHVVTFAHEPDQLPVQADVLVLLKRSAVVPVYDVPQVCHDRANLRVEPQALAQQKVLLRVQRVVLQLLPVRGVKLRANAIENVARVRMTTGELQG